MGREHGRFARDCDRKHAFRKRGDIDTSLNEFVVPKWLSECNYTIDNEASPKTVSVSWTTRRATMIILR